MEIARPQAAPAQMRQARAMKAANLAVALIWVAPALQVAIAIQRVKAPAALWVVARRLLAMLTLRLLVHRLLAVRFPVFPKPQHLLI